MLCCAQLSSVFVRSLLPSWLLSCSGWTILSTDFLLGHVCDMKSFVEMDVTIVMGLCCGEFDTKFINSTVSELLHDSKSALIKDDFRLRCCCLFLAVPVWIVPMLPVLILVQIGTVFHFVGLFFLLEFFVVPFCVGCFLVVVQLLFDGPGCSVSLVTSAVSDGVLCSVANSCCAVSFSLAFCSSK